MFRLIRVLIVAVVLTVAGIGTTSRDVSSHAQYHYYCGPSAIGGVGGTIYRYHHVPGGGLIYNGSFQVGEWGYHVFYGC